MGKYFDFVLVKIAGENVSRLFYAPRWSGLQSGDEVVVEHENCERRAVVLASMTLNKDDTKEIDFVMRATQSPDNIGKVLRQVTFKDFDYTEEEGE